MKIPRIPVSSSQVESVGYHEPTKQLDVCFKSFRKQVPGTEVPPLATYRYQNVTPEQFDALMGAESKGKFINATLKANKDAHPFRRLSVEEAEQ